MYVQPERTAMRSAVRLVKRARLNWLVRSTLGLPSSWKGKWELVWLSGGGGAIPSWRKVFLHPDVSAVTELEYEGRRSWVVVSWHGSKRAIMGLEFSGCLGGLHSLSPSLVLHGSDPRKDGGIIPNHYLAEDACCIDPGLGRITRAL